MTSSRSLSLNLTSFSNYTSLLKTNTGLLTDTKTIFGDIEVIVDGKGTICFTVIVIARFLPEYIEE